MFAQYKDNLTNWSEQKYKIHKEKKQRYFQEREIWWCSVGLNVGYEVHGKGEEFTRPVLIYKKINNSMFFGIPLTKATRKRKSWYLYNEQQGYIAFEQMRAFSAKRLRRKYKKIPKGDFSAITQALLKYMSPKY